MRNLKLEELFVGAWVQQYMKIPDKYSPPMYVYGVWKGGGMYLDMEGNEGDPFDADIQEVFPIPIDEKILKCFGFTPAKGDNVWVLKVEDFRLTVALKWKHGSQVVRRVAVSGRVSYWNEEIRYVHELQRWWVDRVYLPFNVKLELEWRTVKS